jgi:hypothetical protein
MPMHHRRPAISLPHVIVLVFFGFAVAMMVGGVWVLGHI